MTLPLDSGTWALDRPHTTVEFSARHMGISKVRGRFTGFDARLDVGNDLAATSLWAEIDLSTVDTDNEMRDAHLRNADFFNVDVHPTMVFQSTTITDNGNGTYLVHGDLTLNGRTNQLDLLVEFNGTETFPGDGSFHAGFSATGALSRKDYGIDFNVPIASGGFVISDRIGIDLEVQLIPSFDRAAVGA